MANGRRSLSGAADAALNRLPFLRELLDREGMVKRIARALPAEGMVGRAVRRFTPVPIPSDKLNKPALIEKMVERLRFETAGVELYDAVIERVEGELPPDMVTTLRDHRAEEAAHMEMLARHILDVGGDPAAESPGVRLVDEQSRALLSIVKSDNARASHRLQCILDAELEDSVSWELLVALAREGGTTEMVRDFLQAERREVEHARDTRKMIARIAGHEVLGHPLTPAPMRL